MTDADMSMVVATQTAMAETLSQQAVTLSDISRTLADQRVDQVRIEERIINILEDNKSRDSEVSQLRGRIQKLDNMVTLNKFALNFYPQILWLIGGTAAFCISATVAFMKLMP